MPSMPYLVYGMVRNHAYLHVHKFDLKLTTSTGIHNIHSDNHTYLIDLANYGYNTGETINYEFISRTKNQNKTGSFVVDDKGGKELNVVMGHIIDSVYCKGNRDTQLCSISGKPHSANNPIYVTESAHGHVMNNYANEFVGAQSATTIITPYSSDRHLEVHRVYVSTNDKLTDITLEWIKSGTIFKLYTTNTQTATATKMHNEGNDGEGIKLTCGAGTFVSITYHYN